MACEKGEHELAPGRKEGTERCRKCSWAYPCREENCGHSDCIEFRGELPRCYYCKKRVEGPPTSFANAKSELEVLRVGSKDGTWGTGNVVGVNRSFHHACRV